MSYYCFSVDIPSSFDVILLHVDASRTTWEYSTPIGPDPSRVCEETRNFSSASIQIREFPGTMVSKTLPQGGGCMPEFGPGFCRTNYGNSGNSGPILGAGGCWCRF